MVRDSSAGARVSGAWLDSYRERSGGNFYKLTPSWVRNSQELKLRGGAGGGVHDCVCACVRKHGGGCGGRTERWGRGQLWQGCCPVPWSQCSVTSTGRVRPRGEGSARQPWSLRWQGLVMRMGGRQFLSLASQARCTCVTAWGSAFVPARLWAPAYLSEL